MLSLTNTPTPAQFFSLHTSNFTFLFVRLFHAEAELWCHAFSYLKSMALQCAIKLGIPNAIHRCGGTASLPELHAALPVAVSKRPCVSRIMTFLAASRIFSEEIPADGNVCSRRAL